MITSISILFLESDMLNHTKETNAALLQRHYLQAFQAAQNQQVFLVKRIKHILDYVYL